MKAKFLFTGTGSSLGIPVVGCCCASCVSQDHRNHRLRSGAQLTLPGNKTYLIDAGPDIRAQLLKWKISHFAGLLLTHAHYDHVAGLDDLRPLYFKEEKVIKGIASAETINTLRYHYPYLVGEDKKISLEVAKGSGERIFQGLPLTYFTYDQAGMEVLGFRFGNLAYVTDIKEYTPDIFCHLQGLTTLVISALRHSRSPMHLTIEEAIAFADLIKPSKTYFTHIAHDIEHRALSKQLPSSYFLGYDGLILDVEI